MFSDLTELFICKFRFSHTRVLRETVLQGIGFDIIQHVKSVFRFFARGQRKKEVISDRPFQGIFSLQPVPNPCLHAGHTLSCLYPPSFSPG